MQERLGQHQALGLATRQCLAPRLAFIQQIDDSQALLDPLPAHCPPTQRVRVGMKVEKLPHLQIRRHRRHVRHVSHDSPRRGRRLQHVVAGNDHLPVGRLHQRRQHLEGARLPRPVRPHQPVYHPPRDRQTHIIHRDEITVVDPQVTDLDRTPGHLPHQKPASSRRSQSRGSSRPIRRISRSASSRRSS